MAEHYPDSSWTSGRKKSSSRPEEKLAAAILSQQIYYPTTPVISQGRELYSVTFAFPPLGDDVAKIYDALKTLGFDFGSLAESGVGVVKKARKTGDLRQSPIVSVESAKHNSEGKYAQVIFDAKGIEKLISAGVHNPVLNVLAKEMGIERPHADRARQPF